MKNMKLPQLLYTVAFMILSLKNILDSSKMFNRPEWVDTVLLLAFFGLIIVKICTQSYTWKQIVIYGIVGLLCIYTCYSQVYFYLLFSFLGIICLQDVDLQETVRYTAMVKLMLIVMHVVYFIFMFVALSGRVPMVWRNGVGRYYFYLGHPNTFSAYVLWLSLELAYGFYKRINRGHILLFYGMNIISYLFTNSNTGIMVSTFAFFLMFCDKSHLTGVTKRLGTISSRIMLVLAIVIPGIVISYPYLSGSLMEAFKALNDFFTGRLLFGAYAYDTFGFTLFGQRVYLDEVVFWRGNWIDALYFDNAYLWMFCKYGYFYMIFLSLAFLKIGKRADILDQILIIALALYGIMEAYIINAGICFALLIIGKYLYKMLDERKQEQRLSHERKCNAMKKESLGVELQ